jgi:hypothetical protein
MPDLQFALVQAVDHVMQRMTQLCSARLPKASEARGQLPYPGAGASRSMRGLVGAQARRFQALPVVAVTPAVGRGASTRIAFPERPEHRWIGAT